MKVYIVVDDLDLHGTECDCGLCNANGYSYGASVYPEADCWPMWPEGIQRFYSASPEAAIFGAADWAYEMGHEVTGRSIQYDC